jgi:hypothetical protein
LVIMAMIEAKTTKAIDALKEQLDKTTSKITEEIKTATIGMNNMTVKLAETTLSYKDALTQPDWQNQETGLNNVTNPRSRAREGVKSRQILIDIDQTQDPDALKNDSTAAIKEKANKVIQETRTGLTEHKVKVVTCLRNGGILLAFNSEDTVKWLQEEVLRMLVRRLLRVPRTLWSGAGS